MKESMRKLLMQQMEKDHKSSYDMRSQNDMRICEMQSSDRWQYNPKEDEPFMRNMQMRDQYDHTMDGMQGVKGTGPYGIGGSMHYPKDRANMPDGERGPDPDPRLWRRYGAEDNEGKNVGLDQNYNQMGNYNQDFARGDQNSHYRMDGADYGEEIHVKKEHLKKWKQELKNENGTMGERFTMREIMPIAQQMGVRFDKFTEEEFCMVVNMLYSDMCKVWQDVLNSQNELHHYVAAAKQWLTDKDALKGSEKLAAYYYFIVAPAKENGEDFRYNRR